MSQRGILIFLSSTKMRTMNGLESTTYRNLAPGTKGSFVPYYGLLFHEFGPKQCPIHLKCWISILPCEKLNVSRVTSDFQKDNARHNIQNKDRNTYSRLK